MEAANTDRLVLVRDTTNRAGYTMPVAPQGWQEFITRVKGEFRPQ